MNLTGQHQAQRHLDDAQACLDSGLSTKAHQHIGECLALTPDNPRALLVNAQIYLAMGKPDAARQALDAHDLYAPQARNHPAVRMLRIATLVAPPSIQRLAAPTVARTNSVGQVLGLTWD